jgi:hypothetical protein
VDIGHVEECKTRTFLKKIRLFEGRKNNLYLPFNKTENENFFSFLRGDKNRKELFMRSVLIKDFYFDIRVSTTIFEISTLVANVNSRKFIPDISRNNLDSESKDMINYVIGKAIHQGANEALNLNADEKAAFSKFIANFYSKNTEYEK